MGRHLVYPKNSPLCDLYQGMAVRMEVPVAHFGDSDGELPGLADPTYKGVVKA